MSQEISEMLALFDDLVSDHLAQEQATPVRPAIRPAQLRQKLDLSLGETGQALHTLKPLLAQLLELTPSTASTRFFNQLFAGRDAAALLGDMLAAFLNNSMYTYKLTGPHTLIEQEVIARMGRLMGYEQADGVCTPGGSLSNLMGMLLARNEAQKSARNDGLDGRLMRIYTSEESHYSVRKAAGVLGIGRDSTVTIRADARGRMCPETLRQTIQRDRDAGMLPVMINATAGTTVQGSFDPLPPIADIAETFGVWLHIDAAYGGTMVFHPDFKPYFEGSERAHSITWDAHKIMGTPLTCSVILVRQPGLLEQHLGETASYLFQGDSEAIDLGNRSLQCGRRNDALKLWLAWKVHGDEGFTQRVARLRELTEHARDRVLHEPALRLIRPPESINVCFQVQGVDAAVLCRRLNAQAEVMVGHAMVGEACVVRVVFLNPDISKEDVDVFFDRVLAVSESMRDS